MECRLKFNHTNDVGKRNNEVLYWIPFWSQLLEPFPLQCIFLATWFLKPLTVPPGPMLSSPGAPLVLFSSLLA